MIACLAIFSMLVGYNIYSTQQIQQEGTGAQQYLTQEEIENILNEESGSLSATEQNNIEESLIQNRYAFSVFIETENQEGFNTPDLLKEFLITDEVVSYVEETTGIQISPNPELAVVVDRIENTPIQRINIGTGDEAENEMIANAYYDAVEEGIVTYLQNKNVYNLEEEPALQTEIEESDIQEEFNSFSTIELAILFVVIAVVGAFIGIGIAMLRTFSKDQVTEFYGLQNKETDTVLPFYRMKNKTESEMNSAIAHSSLYPAGGKKLLLSQYDLSEHLIAELKNKENELTNQVTIANEFSETDLAKRFDEIIIIIEITKTTKTWYQNQRIQLEKANLPITIIEIN